MFRQLPIIAITAALGLVGATGVASAQATGTENNATSGSMKGSDMKSSGSDMKNSEMKGSSSGSMEMKDKSSSDMKPTGQMKDDQMKSTPNSSMQK